MNTPLKFKATIVLLMMLLLASKLLAQSSPKIDFNASQLLCTVNFSPVTQDLSSAITSYQWDFGDGTQSSERAPVHQFIKEGKFAITLTVTYLTEGKVETVSKRRNFRFASDKKINFTETTLSVQTSQCDQVLDAEIYTYTDYAPGHIEGASSDRFLSGNSGVWKQDKVYHYVTSRDSGVYKIPSFNWNAEQLNETGWSTMKKGDRITSSNQFIEGIDQQGIRTASLLDKTQQHIIASGINMHYEEMAFTGFEDQSLTTGNWIVSDNTARSSKLFSVLSGYGNFILVDASPEETANLTTLDVWAKNLADATTIYKSDVVVACQEAYSKNKNWSILILAESPFEKVWSGQVQTRTLLQPSVSGIYQDNEIHHSGMSSLRVIKSNPIKQELLLLTPSKEYVINLWGSTVLSRERNISADGSGVELTFEDKKGNVIKREQFTPAGQTIEGWQQIEGRFTFPAVASALSIRFLTNGISWYDDLRLFPAAGNMQSFVYETIHKKIAVALDENNRATYYFYQSDGSLYQEKKETDDGVKTVVENIAYTKGKIKP